MANQLKDHLIDPLTLLLKRELKFPVFWDSAYKARAPLYVALTLLDDILLEEDATSQTRRGRVAMRLYSGLHDTLASRSYENSLADGAEKIKAVIFSARDYSETNSYYWHEGQVESVDYAPTLTEREQEAEALAVVEVITGFTITEFE